MSSYAHKVLLAIRNPFMKADPDIVSKPHFVWLTRDEIANGFNPSPGTEYLLLIYRMDGTVKWHFRLEVRFPMHP